MLSDGIHFSDLHQLDQKLVMVEYGLNRRRMIGTLFAPAFGQRRFTLELTSGKTVKCRLESLQSIYLVLELKTRSVKEAERQKQIIEEGH